MTENFIEDFIMGGIWMLTFFPAVVLIEFAKRKTVNRIGWTVLFVGLTALVICCVKAATRNPARWNPASTILCCVIGIMIIGAYIAWKWLNYKENQQIKK